MAKEAQGGISDEREKLLGSQPIRDQTTQMGLLFTE